jgi:uncharacterized BrkB/YihY/UPF0761 family membrane protein
MTDSITGAIDRVDHLQQRRPVTAVPCAVVRKYSDDRAGQLAGQISHAAFLAVFPMLLVLLTLVGLVLHGHPGLQDDIINSALRQFPVLGSDLKKNVHQLSTSNQVALVVGTLWLIYGSMRLSRASQIMMAKVWDIHRDDLPDFWHWIPRAAGFLVVLGVGFLAGGALAGLGAFGRLGSFSSWVGLVLSLVVKSSCTGGRSPSWCTSRAGIGPSGPEPSSGAWGGRSCSSPGPSWSATSCATSPTSTGRSPPSSASSGGSPSGP